MSEKFKQQNNNEAVPTVAADLETAVQHIENLLKQAGTDPLTGAANREGFAKKLREYFDGQKDSVEEFLSRMKGVDAHSEAQRSAEHIGKGSVIMLDIDHFKEVNNGYGHDAGDVVLKTFARIVKDIIRNDDVLSRFGGEEFVLLCPDTDAHGAQILAQRILAAVAEFNIEIANHSEPLKITVSAGVAQISEPRIVGGEHVEYQSAYTLRQTTPQMVSAAITRADRALYAAKAEGRNSVRLDSDMVEDLDYTDKAA